MKIACVGAGPAGLYSAILMKLRDPESEITVFERNPAGVTHGWGVVFWNDLVAELRRNDLETAEAILQQSFSWIGQVVDIKGGSTAYVDGGGHGISRQTLLDILRKRATDLGVTISYEHDITDPSQLPKADLIVAADGVGSQIRRLHEADFDPQVEPGRNMYVWLATPRVFEAFTFAFVPTEAGWIWCHAYGYSNDSSTFIAECSPETWRGLGFDGLNTDQSLRLLERLFDEQLEGQPLLSHSDARAPLPWLHFRSLTTNNWYVGNIVLVGDAAHTTHFTIGSGTRLAMADAIALADSLHSHRDVSAALAAYESERQFQMRRPRREARLSAAWFENFPRYITLEGPRLLTLLLARRSRLMPHVPPRVYYDAYQVKRIPVVRKLYRWATRRMRDVEKRLAGARSPGGRRAAVLDEDA